MNLPIKIPCPYTYSKGGRCAGHVVRIEAYKADLWWCAKPDGSWTFTTGEPRSHYHLFCSEKGNHAGFGRPDSESMKFYYDQLPEKLKAVIVGRAVPESDTGNVHCGHRKDVDETPDVDAQESC